MESNEENVSENMTYKMNLTVNKDKRSFWKFLVYGTKLELHITEFQSLLFWVSILECFLFLICLALFISSPNNFSIIWIFIIHVIRALLGFILLKRIPHSYTVIEQFKEFENDSVEDLENNILQLYKNLLLDNESKIKPVLVFYFVFTIIDIILDNVAFFYLTTKWSDSAYSLQNIISLIIIVVFFLCNAVYFSWLTSIKFNFPPEMRKPVFFAICGFFTGIKNAFVDKVKLVYQKTKGRFSKNETENSIDQKGNSSEENNKKHDENL